MPSAHFPKLRDGNALALSHHRHLPVQAIARPRAQEHHVVGRRKCPVLVRFSEKGVIFGMVVPESKVNIEDHAAKDFFEGPLVPGKGQSRTEKIVVIAVAQIPIFAQESGQSMAMESLANAKGETLKPPSSHSPAY